MKVLALMGTILLLAGCASNVNVTPQALGGSKADGMVELGFEIGELQTPIIDEAEALKIAQKRCEGWGYSQTEKFGGLKRRCLLVGGLFSPCAYYSVTMQYQCKN